MRTLPILTAGLVALALASPALAAPEGQGGRMGYDPAAPLARADVLARANARFDGIDANGDGQLDKAELAAHRAKLREMRAERMASLTEEQQARRAERRAQMQERWAKRGKAGAREGARGGWFAQIDTNGDGLISRDEFTAPALKRFDRADADSDGIVTPEERAAMRAARKATRG